MLAAFSAARIKMAANGADVVDACFDSDVYRDSSSAQRVFDAGCAPETADGPPRFSGFAFFDGIHPTGALHAALGDALSDLF
jgi:hypothetical protein